MVDWKGAFQLFATVAGLAAVGVLMGYAEAGALMGSFRVEYGYLPLLVALVSGATAVGVHIGIGVLRKLP